MKCEFRDPFGSCGSESEFVKICDSILSILVASLLNIVFDCIVLLIILFCKVYYFIV